MSDYASPREQPVRHGDELPYEGASDAGTWLRHSLGEEWVAAFRITEQDGEHVVAELRVYPREPGEEDRRGVDWGGDPAAVPLGGITTRLVRTVKVATALASGQHAIETVAQVLPPELAPTGEAAHRPRRRKRDDLLLARVAIRYDQAREAGSTSPSLDTCERLQRHDHLYYTPGSVRQLIAAARKRDFITPTRQGSGKGRATDKARATIDAYTSKTGTPTS